MTPHSYKCFNAFSVAIISLFLCLSACSRPHEGDGKAIFRYNEPAGIATLDPAFAKDQARIWASSQLFNGLVRLDSALNVEPCIAKSWTISNDGRTYTFLLRDDVFFHQSPLFATADSTRKVVASDLLYSFQRVLNPQVASPGRWIFSHLAENGLAAPNDSTFIVSLSEPFPPMLALLAMPYCGVVPFEVVDFYGDDFRNHPIGTGPFRFQYWKEGVKLVLRKNERYFERDSSGLQLPYLDAIAITFIVDKQTAFLEFMKGNLDFMNSLDASYKDEILTPSGHLKPQFSNRISLVSVPFLNTEYLGFKMDSVGSPLSDVRVRQAINYGFDRRKMMRYLRNNIGYPGVGGMIPIGLPGSIEIDSASPNLYGYYYDPLRAKQLLADAGYPDGNGLPEIQLATTSSYLDLCKYIQQQLALCGIRVKLDVNPPAALREQIAQGKAAWFRGSWIADYPDAENYLSLFFSPNLCPVGPNYTHYHSSIVDNLYRQAMKAHSLEQRIHLYRTIDSLIMIDAPVVVLYYDQILHFTHNNISGLRSNAMNALDLRFVRKDN